MTDTTSPEIQGPIDEEAIPAEAPRYGISLEISAPNAAEALAPFLEITTEQGLDVRSINVYRSN